MVGKAFNYLRGKAAGLKGSVKLDINVDLDMTKYKENSDASCAGQMIRDVGVMSLSKAQKLCDKDPQCNCLTRMDKKFGGAPKGNFRLEKTPKSGSKKLIKDRERVILVILQPLLNKNKISKIFIM